MKKVLFKLLTVSVLAYFSGQTSAQEIDLQNIKFIHPIVEKWVSEYKKTYPDSKLDVKLQASEGVAALKLVVNTGDEALDNSGTVIYTGRFALIPISNKNNPLLAKAGKGLKKKDLQKLVFEREPSDDDDDYEDTGKEKYTATIYSRNGQAATTLALAEHFDRSPDLIKGKKIAGDEIYLVDAISKDENGLAFNTLNYVYDLTTRRLKSNLTVLPLNLKQEIREALLSHDIDRTISALEDIKTEVIPVSSFGLIIPKNNFDNADILRFAEWVLENGQKFNHELGFLTLDSATLESQQKQLKKQNQALAAK